MALRGEQSEGHWLVGSMSEPEVIHLSERGVHITNTSLALGNSQFPTGSVEAAWVETRRPGLIHGGLMLALGAAVLVRGAVFLKVLGVLLMAFGLLRLRVIEHAVKLRLRSGKEADALRTADARWAGTVLRAIEAAKGA